MYRFEDFLEIIKLYSEVYFKFENFQKNKDNIFIPKTGDQNIISRKSGQKIQKIANLQYYKSKANYGTKKKGISR